MKKNHELQSSIGSRKLCVPLVVPGVIVETSHRSDACGASGDRTPTASGDRGQDLPKWLQQFAEVLIEGEAGSSSRAGETIPTTSPPPIPARPSN